MIHVPVLEDLHRCAGEPHAQDKRGVVELIADDEASLGEEAGDVEGVGGESHPAGQSILHAKELGNGVLKLKVVAGAAKLLSTVQYEENAVMTYIDIPLPPGLYLLLT